MQIIRTFRNLTRFFQLVSSHINVKKNNGFLVKYNSSDFSFFGEDNEIILKYKGENIGGFKYCQLPGCCGVMLLYNVRIRFDFQNKGIGTQVFKIVEKIAEEKNFTILMCTDVVGRTSERIIEKLGWHHIFSFVNKKTENHINISIKKL